MSGAPPSQQPVTCDSCGAQKQTEQRTVGSNSSKKKTDKSQDKGSANGKYFSGGISEQEAETRGWGDKTNKTAIFNVCQTEGCFERVLDRYDIVRWERRQNPNLTNSSENRKAELDRIMRDEREHVDEVKYAYNEFQAMGMENIDTESKRGREQDERRYRNESGNQEVESSGKSASDSTTESDNAQDQNATIDSNPGDTPENDTNEQDTTIAPEWGDTADNDTTAWTSAQAADTNANDQGATATAGNDTTPWGNPRDADTNANEQGAEAAGRNTDENSWSWGDSPDNDTNDSKQDSTTATASSTTGTTNTPSDTEKQSSEATAFEQSVRGNSQTGNRGSEMASGSPMAEAEGATTGRAYDATNEEEDEGDSQSSPRRSW